MPQIYKITLPPELQRALENLKTDTISRSASAYTDDGLVVVMPAISSNVDDTIIDIGGLKIKVVSFLFDEGENGDE